MGISNLFYSVKSWTMQNVFGYIEKHEESKGLPNLGEDIRQVLQAEEFEQTYQSASPFLMASLGAWPGYWVYRGLDYHSHRAHVSLPNYIRQTFYQAKLLQFAIIMAGIYSVMKENKRACMNAAREETRREMN